MTSQWKEEGTFKKGEFVEKTRHNLEFAKGVVNEDTEGVLIGIVNGSKFYFNYSGKAHEDVYMNGAVQVMVHCLQQLLEREEDEKLADFLTEKVHLAMKQLVASVVIGEEIAAELVDLLEVKRKGKKNAH